jgi:hypothetical protein
VTVLLITLAAVTLAMLAVAARHAWVNRPPVTYDSNTGFYRSARMLVREHDGGYGPRRPIHRDRR